MKLIFLLLFSISSFACELEIPQYLVWNKNTSDPSALSFLFKKNCTEHNKKKLTEFLVLNKGLINNYHLKEVSTEFQSDRTKFYNLNLQQFLEKNLFLKSDFKIQNVQTNLNTETMALNNQSEFNLNCNDCNVTGKKTIKLYVNGLPSWINFELKRKFIAPVLTKDLPAFFEGDISQFISHEEVLLDQQSSVFTDTKNLKFFKPNKPLKKGSFLKSSDFVAKKLIKFGEVTYVKIKSNGIDISTKAIAQGSGEFGQSILFKNINSNKKFTATITDYNKAIIEL